MRTLTKKYKVKLIINDSPVLAKKINADGCHLGQSDVSIKDSKNLWIKYIQIKHYSEIIKAINNHKANVIKGPENDKNYVDIAYLDKYLMTL